MKFEIAREPADLSYDDFCAKYFDAEQPVIIENVSSEWAAPSRWTEQYIREKLSQEPSAKAASLWYWMERDTLGQDYKTPNIINTLIDSPAIFPRAQLMRIWIHGKNNVSSWHYDANMVNVFNAQITGQKEWTIVSPDTPLACYPFVNFAVMGEADDKMLAGKTYANFMLNEGDMLYIPPLWFHKVRSIKDENISLNWIFTKKETQVNSKTLHRELERYTLQTYLTGHRFKLVQTAFNNINARIPGYLRWKWAYPTMIKTPVKPRAFQLIKRTFNEMAVLGKVLRHINKIKPYIDGLKPIKKLVAKR